MTVTDYPLNFPAEVQVASLLTPTSIVDPRYDAAYRDQRPE